MKKRKRGKLQRVVNFRNADESGQGDVLPHFDFDQSISSTNLATNLVDGHRTSNFCTPATQRTSLHEWTLVPEHSDWYIVLGFTLHLRLFQYGIVLPNVLQPGFANHSAE